MLRIRRSAVLTAALFLAGFAQAQKPYFQQQVDYTIRVRLDDQAHFLHGQESFVYTNHSPDPLDGIWIHLWPNAFADRTSAFAAQKINSNSTKFWFAPDKTLGYIDSLEFTTPGQKLSLEPHPSEPDIAFLKFEKDLQPGQQLTISTPFRVKIPDSYSRLGHIGQQYQLTQWYPKPAVYDNRGWHPIPYLDQGEFYSEYGSFDVTIEVPQDYVVGATGDLDADSPEWAWLAEREAQTRALLEKPAGETENPFETHENPVYKSLRFRQDRVHDFAWFCDKQYFVLADTVKLPESGREVRCVAMFTNADRDLWVRGPEYVSQAVYYYSLWNGEYPYNICTAVDGALSAGAGMEYPTITVLGAGGSASSLETVVVHEVGHNWYYGILGSDERTYPWMDEGLNTFFENRYTKEQALNKARNMGGGLSLNLMADLGLQVMQGFSADQPIEAPAETYTSLNYGLDVYMKTGMVFRYLESYLGREVTDRCFHAYYDTWKFRHPMPDDIQAVFEKESGKDLDWFFDVYLQEPWRVDFRVKKIEGNQVTVQNHSGCTLPASVTLYDREGKELGTWWTEPFDKETTITVDAEAAHHARVNADKVIPEYRTDNNRTGTGLFAHCKAPRLGIGYRMETDSTYGINLLPALGMNTTDGFMLGLMVNHGILPQYKSEYTITGMYGFRSQRPTGSINWIRHWRPRSVFRKVDLRLRAGNYANLLRGQASLDFTLDRPLNKYLQHSFSLNSFLLGTWLEDGEIFPSDFYLPVYGALRWKTYGSNAISTFQANAELGGNTAEKTYRALGSVSYRYKFGKRLWVKGRAFAGLMMAPEGAGPYLLQMRMGGSNDPFGETYLADRARTSGFFSRQITPDHGGFHTLEGFSADRALTTVNAELGGFLPLASIFADAGMGTHSVTGSTGLRWGTGLRIALPYDILAFNFPVAGTVFADGVPADFRDFGQNITFSFEPLNVLRLARDQAGLD